MSAPSSILDNEKHARIFAETIVPESGINDVQSQAKPKAIVLAGQPGAGKGGLKRSATLELLGDVVSIDPDELRDAHPNVEKLRERYPYTWADHTHADASARALAAIHHSFHPGTP